MTVLDDQRREIEALFVGYSSGQVHALCVEALREWRTANANVAQFSMHGDLGLRLLDLLQAERPGHRLGDIGSLKERFLDSNEEPWMVDVLEFTHWLVRAGYATPLMSASTQHQYPVNYRVMPAGLAFFALAAGHEHPLLPGAIERLRDRCQGLTEGIVALLLDARTCLEHALYRPAVVVMGVAFETAVEEVIESLVRAQAIANVPSRAAERIATLRAALPTLVPGQQGQAQEQRRAAGDALVFADQLRARRNDASHTTPRYGFEDREEVEELLVSAGRHLPALWSLYRA